MANLTAAIMVFIIIVAGAVGFIALTGAFEHQYNSAISDPINNTGILLNNTTGYEAVQTTSQGIAANLPAAILMGFLLVSVFLILLIFGVLKR